MYLHLFKRISNITTHNQYRDQVFNLSTQRDFEQPVNRDGVDDHSASNQIDAVYIATPVYFHPEHFEAAVDAGKHVYLEKPVGLDVPGVKRVLRAATRSNGTTIADYRTSEGVPGGYQNRLRVYDREGEKCRRCGRRIKRLVLAQRSAHYCPGCQR